MPDVAVPGARAGPAAVWMSPGRGLNPRPLPYQVFEAMRCAAEFRGVIIICPDKCSSRLPRATPGRREPQPWSNTHSTSLTRSITYLRYSPSTSNRLLRSIPIEGPFRHSLATSAGAAEGAVPKQSLPSSPDTPPIQPCSHRRQVGLEHRWAARLPGVQFPLLPLILTSNRRSGERIGAAVPAPRAGLTDTPTATRQGSSRWGRCDRATIYPPEVDWGQPRLHPPR